MDKKVTVGYFLDTRLKAITHQGKEHYPLYARVAFDRKNSNIKVLGVHGDTIYMNQEDFDFEFKTLAEPNYMTLWMVLNKEKLIKDAIEYEYEQIGDKFKLPEFVKRFRVYERYLFLTMENKLIEELKLFYENALDINLHKQVFSYEQLERIVDSLINLNKLDLCLDQEHLKDLFGAYLSLHSFTFSLYNNPNPDYRGTYFGWFIKADRQLFADYCSRYSPYISYVSIPPAIVKMSEKIKSIPVKEKVEQYIQLIDNECFEAGLVFG